MALPETVLWNYVNSFFYTRNKWPHPPLARRKVIEVCPSTYERARRVPTWPLRDNGKQHGWHSCINSNQFHIRCRPQGRQAQWCTSSQALRPDGRDRKTWCNAWEQEGNCRNGSDAASPAKLIILCPLLDGKQPTNKTTIIRTWCHVLLVQMLRNRYAHLKCFHCLKHSMILECSSVKKEGTNMKFICCRNKGRWIRKAFQIISPSINCGIYQKHRGSECQYRDTKRILIWAKQKMLPCPFDCRAELFSETRFQFTISFVKKQKNKQN